jgi:DNA-binding transcriptional MerR regulator
MKPNHSSLSISALATACGVTTPTIRYYEKIGLLPQAERSRSDQRRYSPKDIERLTFIRRCRDFGFSLKQVRALVSLSISATEDCQSARDIALSRVTEIRAKIADLYALEKSLFAMVEVCDSTCLGGSSKDCAAFSEFQLPT